MPKLRILILLIFVFPSVALLINGSTGSTPFETYAADTNILDPYPHPDVECQSTNCLPNYNFSVYLPLMSYDFTIIPTFSYYVYDLDTLYSRGCDSGTLLSSNPKSQYSFIFLHFGAPNRKSDLSLGTVTFSGEPVTVDEIRNSVVNFSQGFLDCNNLDTINIAVGTSNSGREALRNIASSHGYAWANMVSVASTQVASLNENNGRVRIYGGSNIEPGFGAFDIAQTWLVSYTSASYYPPKIIYIIAAAEGCPWDYPLSVSHPTPPQPYPCNSQWNQDNIYEITNGHGINLPYPQIYNYTNANQWYRISLYTRFKTGHPMSFTGTLSEQTACSQVGCGNDMNLGPLEGLKFFKDLLASDTFTINGNYLMWASDMKHDWPY